MRSFVLFCLVFCGKIVFAQQNYLEIYYPHINKAEEALIKDNFAEAVKHYNEAFKNVDSPLARDLFNGVACNYMLGEKDVAKAWLILLAKKGVNPELIETQEVFQVQKVWADWQRFKPVYTQILNSFKPQVSPDFKAVSDSINASLREIKEIYSHLPDQAFDISDEPMSSVDSLLVTKSYELIDHIYEKTALQASEYILSEGFISEDNSGISSENLMADGFRSFILNNNFYQNIINSKEDTLIGFPKKDLLINLNERFLDAVKKGAIHRDYVIDLVKSSDFINNENFVLTLIPNEIECGERKAYVLLKEKSNAKYPFFNETLTSFETEKSKYVLFKNELFLMSSSSEVEEIIIDACSELDNIKKSATLLEDIKL